MFTNAPEISQAHEAWTFIRRGFSFIRWRLFAPFFRSASSKSFRSRARRARRLIGFGKIHFRASRRIFTEYPSAHELLTPRVSLVWLISISGRCTINRAERPIWNLVHKGRDLVSISELCMGKCCVHVMNDIYVTTRTLFSTSVLLILPQLYLTRTNPNIPPMRRVCICQTLYTMSRIRAGRFGTRPGKYFNRLKREASKNGRIARELSTPCLLEVLDNSFELFQRKFL